MLDHCAVTTGIRKSGFAGSGYFGVMLFFVHTALVLMLSMERWNLTGIRLFISFLVRRIFRIYPLSMLLVVTAILLRVPTDASRTEAFFSPGWAGFFSNFFLVQNVTHHESTIGVLWSLPFEMQMYIALPIFFLMVRHRETFVKRRRIVALIWIASAAAALLEFSVRYRSLDVNIYALQHFLIIRYFPCFIAGIVAWIGLSARKRVLAGRWWILFTFSVIVAFKVSDVALRQNALSGLLPAGFNLNAERALLESVRDWVLCISVGVAIPFFRDISIPWLNRPTHLIAKYSYGIYICHLPLLWFFTVKVWPRNQIFGAIATIAATAAISPVLYHLLEHPAIQLGKRIAQAFTPRPTSVAERSSVPV